MMILRVALAGFLLLNAGFVCADVPTKPGAIAASQAVLRALDKLEGKAEDLVVPVGQTVNYRHLNISVEACHYPKGRRQTASYALLKIKDMRLDQSSFYGWMFASSPALSALEHPRYDIWVLRCSE